MPATLTPNKLGFRILNWLLENGNKKLEPERWAAMLGIEIIDWDGWRKFDLHEECDLPTFLKRVTECTIFPLD